LKLAHITLTGADDTTSIDDLLEISRTYPLVEWGILLSSKSMGNGRYPNAEWIKDLSHATYDNIFGPRKGRAKFAAHLCGPTMRSFMKTSTVADDTWTQIHGISEQRFNSLFSRAQINFNAIREKFTDKNLIDMLEGWYETADGNLITQHNDNNTGVWKPLQAYEMENGALKAHQILHDASGGLGHLPDSWQKPIAGVLNGYAGGISPDNVIATLEDLETIVGEGFTWIDMESSLRDDQDRFCIDTVKRTLDIACTAADKRGWI
jgi:hypothetical protein